jgi:hypothetical protein
MSLQLLDIWPKGIGYDTNCGYHAERFDAKKDPIPRIKLLVDSWKNTAIDHGFNCENVRTLSCQPYANGHRLAILDESSQEKVLNCQVQTMKVDADVDEEPSDTCVRIEIAGKNLDTNNDFSFSLSVYRRPAVKAFTTLK